MNAYGVVTAEHIRTALEELMTQNRITHPNTPEDYVERGAILALSRLLAVVEK